MDKQTTLQTVERALSFLEYVASAPTPPQIRDVADALGLNVTTCYHLQRTLVARLYINRRPDGGLELGEGVRALFRNYQSTLGIDESLGQIVRRLAAQTQETSFLSLVEENSVVLKILIEGAHRLRVAGLYVGMKGREHGRAAGLAVLAHLDDKRKKAMLDASLADLPVATRKKERALVEKQLSDTLARGWSLDDQTEEGILAIGAPIFEANNNVIGAIGIVLPTFRMDRAREFNLEAVLSAATEGSQFLQNAENALQSGAPSTTT